MMIKMRLTIFLILFFLMQRVSGQTKEEIVYVDTMSLNERSDIYVDVDQRPIFQGGSEDLIKFYKKSSKLKVCESGLGCKTVYYQIVINEKGKIIDFKIISGLDKKHNNETERIVKQMPDWTPGAKDGLPVKVLVTLSIKYKID